MSGGGIGLKRLQHLVLWVADVERSVRFYCDVLGFEVKTRYPNAAFLRIPGSAEDHHLGLFAQPGITQPDEGAARMYHAAWEVGELTDLVRARRRLVEAGSLVGSSDHGVSLSLYAKDPDGLEFEVFWTVPDGKPVRTRALDLEGELSRRGIAMPEKTGVAPSA
jgi:catechol-2,3-dioxygenase